MNHNTEYVADKDEINLREYWDILIKWKKTIIGLFIISVISVAVVSFMMPSIYKGEAEMRLPIKDNEMLLILAEEINHSEITDMFPEHQEAIVHLKANPLAKSDDTFKVTIEIYPDLARRVIIADLMNRLLFFINNKMPAMKQLYTQQRNKMTERLGLINEILDKSEKDMQVFKKMASDSKLAYIGYNPLEYHKTLYEYKTEKKNLEKILANPESFNVALKSQPVLLPGPVRPKRAFNIVSAGVASLIFGILLALLLEYTSKISRQKK